MRFAVYVLALALVSSVACDGSHTATNNETLETDSKKALRLVRDPVQVAHDKALRLAKQAPTLVAGILYPRKPDPETVTNEVQIKAQLARTKGVLRISGWHSMQIDDQTYLVTYTYQLDDKSYGYPFEVNLAAEIVRYVMDDPALAKKYGWAPESK